MQPAAAALGAYSAETSPPAENSPMSARVKSKLGQLLDRQLLARETAPLLPSERSLASAMQLATPGNLRSSSTLIMVSPTRPVAPTTATRKDSAHRSL